MARKQKGHTKAKPSAKATKKVPLKAKRGLSKSKITSNSKCLAKVNSTGNLRAVTPTSKKFSEKNDATIWMRNMTRRKHGEFVEQFALLRDIHSDLDEMFEPDDMEKENIEAVERVKANLSLVEDSCLDLVYRLRDIETDARALQLAVIGNFNAGKSSLINSLLGCIVCPVGVCPTTSSITRFSYGPEAIVRQHGRGQISFEEYSQLVCHPTDPGARPNPVFEFEVEYPYDALRDLQIIDTPGFSNAQNQRDTEITIQAAGEADAILFVLDIVTASIGADTLQTLQRIRKAKSDCPWTLVLNCADLKGPPARKNIRDWFASEYQLFDHVVLYSAKWALETEAHDKPSFWPNALRDKIQKATKAGLPLDLSIAGRPEEHGGFSLAVGDEKYRVRYPLSDGVATAEEMRRRIYDIARLKQKAAVAQLVTAREVYVLRANILVESLTKLLGTDGDTNNNKEVWSEDAKMDLQESLEHARGKMKSEFRSAWKKYKNPVTV